MQGKSTVSPFASLQTIARECVNCGVCVKECLFLQEYGSPKELALAWGTRCQGRQRHFVFACSLCGLCHGVCPKKLDPSAMFLDMRRQVVDEGEGRLKEHKTIRAYEKRGSSALFSWFHIPEDCHTVFFPGCALPGSRPQTLVRLYQYLGASIANLGIVLDCCSKPSHDLGDKGHFQEMFGELCQILTRHSVKKVLVACPNCHRIFREYGRGLEVEMVYEHLTHMPGGAEVSSALVTVHDPCGVRFAPEVQQNVREILQGQGVVIREMKHSRSRTYCCGEGGSAGFVRPEFARAWTGKRVAEAGEDLIISYCAGCTNFLGKRTSTQHILDLLFFPNAVLSGRHKVSKAPFTYWNRLRLKKRLAKGATAGVSGSRRQLRRTL